MTMQMVDLEFFYLKTDSKCKLLANFLEKNSIPFVIRDVATDFDAQWDALLFRIYSTPALKMGKSVLRCRDIFEKIDLREEMIMKFVNDR